MTGVDHIMPEVLRLDADDLQLQWLRIKQQFQDLMQRFAWFGDLFSKLSESTKLDIFLNCLGQEAVELYSDVLKTKENINYEDVIQLFDDHIASQNELNSRFNFNQRNQQNGESFDKFYTELRKLVKSCKYREQEEIMLRDRVVLGVLDVNLQRKLLENSRLTLQQAVDICQEHELSNEITTLDIFRGFTPKNKQEQDIEPETYTKIIEDLKSDELSTKMVAMRAARRKLMMKTVNKQDPFTASLVKAGIIGLLVDTLSSHWYEGAIPPLVEMVSGGGGLGEQAARALGAIAFKIPSARIRATEGAIAAICRHLHRDTPTCQLRTYLWACSAISKDGLNEYKECLPHIAELLTVRDEEIILHACSVLDQLTKDSGEHIDAVLDTPLMLTRLIALFERDSLEVKTSAVRVLGNMLAFGTDTQTKFCLDEGFLNEILDLQKQVLDERKCRDGKSELQYLVVRALASISRSYAKQLLFINRGVIPMLVAILPQGGDTAEQAARGLGNIAAENVYVRNEVLDNGALSAILPFMSPATPIKYLQTYVWAYRAMCSHKTPVEIDLVSPGLPNIAKLLTVEDENVLVEALLVLTSIIGWNSKNIDDVQSTPSLMNRVTALLEHGSQETKANALTVVGTMLAGNYTQVKMCLDAGCLDGIIALMRCSTPSLVETATQAASNILGHDHSNVRQRALDRDMLEAVAHVLETGNDSAKGYAVRAMNKLCIFVGNFMHEHRLKLVSSSVLTPYCRLLSSESNNTVLLVLTGLVDLLKESSKYSTTLNDFVTTLRNTGVIDKVRELHKHNDKKISSKAIAFTDAYQKCIK